MKVGVFLVLFSNRSLDEAMAFVASTGVQALELATGGYVGDQVQRSELLRDPARRRALKEAAARHNLEIVTLSCHGNPLHPQAEIREAHRQAFRETVQLANALEVPTVVTFSGCPGDSDQARYPNWVTCPWPDDFLKILEWQWNEKVLPYWTEEAAFLKQEGVRVAIEMHPGFVVYNPETLLRLRQAVGEQVGANLDPSHFFWQGIQPVEAIRALGPAIYHFHAKDTHLDPHNTAVNGVLDTKHYGNAALRSWVFRTVGYGHDALLWSEIISALRLAGYDGVLSIEHEDGLMSAGEGFRKAVEFLSRLVIREPQATMWWA
jgi:sugar phosphate isomerase/epimerase